MVALVVIASLYFVDSAADLPSFLPGHHARSMRHHVGHAIAALILACGAFGVAWFHTGPDGQPARPRR